MRWSNRVSDPVSVQCANHPRQHGASLEFSCDCRHNAGMNFRTPRTHEASTASPARRSSCAHARVSYSALRRHDRGTLACLGSAR